MNIIHNDDNIRKRYKTIFKISKYVKILKSIDDNNQLVIFKKLKSHEIIEIEIYNKIQNKYGETKHLSYMLNSDINHIMLKYINNSKQFLNIIKSKKQMFNRIILSCKDLIKIFSDCLKGLKILHEFGYLHYDIAPRNILVLFKKTSHGNLIGNNSIIEKATLIDFGEAKVIIKDVHTPEKDFTQLMYSIICYIDNNFYKHIYNFKINNCLYILDKDEDKNHFLQYIMLLVHLYPEYNDIFNKIFCENLIF